MAAFDEKEFTQDFDWSIWKRIFPIMGRYKGFPVSSRRAPWTAWVPLPWPTPPSSWSRASGWWRAPAVP